MSEPNPCPPCGSATKKLAAPSGSHWYACTRCKWQVTYCDHPHAHVVHVARNPDASTTREP